MVVPCAPAVTATTSAISVIKCFISVNLVLPIYAFDRKQDANQAPPLLGNGFIHPLWTHRWHRRSQPMHAGAHRAFGAWRTAGNGLKKTPLERLKSCSPAIWLRPATFPKRSRIGLFVTVMNGKAWTRSPRTHPL